MYRDITNIETDFPGDPLTFDAWCYQDDQTIWIYKDDGTMSGIGNVSTYKLVNDKYIHISTTDPAAPIPVNCINQTEASIHEIPSRYEFMSPIYGQMAIMSAVLIIVIAFRILIYPFFRKRG